MKFDEFIRYVGELPVIDTDVLSAGRIDLDHLKIQIGRWVKSEKLIQLKRGIYILNQPYRKTGISQVAISAILKKPSYVSLEKALEHHSLIPEGVYTVTSVTTKRPAVFETKFGNFDYRHIRPSLFWGYETVKFDNQTAFMACPEKALLDWFYLKDVPVSFEYIDEMRLQNTEKIRLGRLKQFAQKFGKPKILRAASLLCEYFKTRK